MGVPAPQYSYASPPQVKEQSVVGATVDPVPNEFPQ